MWDAMGLLLAASIRATAVLAAAWLLVALMRRKSSASARHAVWVCAIGTVVLTPALLQIPSWQVPVPDRLASWSESVGATYSAGELQSVEQAPLAADTISEASSTSDAEPAGLLPVVFVGAVWSAGFVTVLLYVLTGLAAASRLRRTATLLNAGWMDEGRALARSIGVTRVAFAESACAPVPFVCGVAAPLVVMPPDISGWDRDRRRAVLLHELAHVKRRDCLTHLLAQAACAIYWFHPLSWFAAHRLRIEREQACDAAVLAAGVRGSDYAHHLVAVAKNALPHASLLASTGVAMAHRSQLEKRLALILDLPARGTAPRLARFGAVAFAVFALMVASLRLQARADAPREQTGGAPVFEVASTRMNTDGGPVAGMRPGGRFEATNVQLATISRPTEQEGPRPQLPAAPLVARGSPAFEVASVKRAEPGKTGGWVRFLPGGRFVGENVALEFVLQRVYGVRDFQIIAAPPLRAIIKDGYGARYEIEGKGREDSTPEQLTEMVKTLLADRFQLRVHKETRDLPLYALLQTPGGVKVARPADGKGGGIEMVAPGWIKGFGTGTSALALALSRYVDRPVVDGTNLEDVLDFDLTWTTLENAGDADTTPGCHPSFLEMARRSSRYALGASASCPSIFTAVQEQLGLRLDAQLGPVEVLVVDAVQFPTEN